MQMLDVRDSREEARTAFLLSTYQKTPLSMTSKMSAEWFGSPLPTALVQITQEVFRQLATTTAVAQYVAEQGLLPRLPRRPHRG
ncbi:UNVERIFIED_CONTAM: hypothetical protein Sradi_6575100 [Sesamum radiatum]|uniref:Uncharacterized protein n=1 Tax=Sesamum radiatum TaxID=300843 RepID=A0AAW2JZJ3_SESRA